MARIIKKRKEKKRESYYYRGYIWYTTKIELLFDFLNVYAYIGVIWYITEIFFTLIKINRKCVWW